MKVAIGGQGSAFALKEAVKNALAARGHEVVDVGQLNPEEKGFPTAKSVSNVADKVLSGECAKGIVMCGTGAGASLMANKIKGIYCVACESLFTAERIYPMNAANVMAMGAMVVSTAVGCEMAIRYVESELTGGDSLKNVSGIEEKYFK